MNNKPYGWVKNGEYVLYIDKPDSVFNYTPLYTHPVNPYQSITNTKIEPTVVSYTHPVKELTDEEIYAEMVKCIDSPSDGHEFRYKDFAKAILRKASEK